VSEAWPLIAELVVPTTLIRASSGYTQSTPPV
jgi:hypothetical protein